MKDVVGEFRGSGMDSDRWEKQARGLLSVYELSSHQAIALMCPEPLALSSELEARRWDAKESFVR